MLLTGFELSSDKADIRNDGHGFPNLTDRRDSVIVINSLAY